MSNTSFFALLTAVAGNLDERLLRRDSTVWSGSKAAGSLRSLSANSGDARALCEFT